MKTSTLYLVPVPIGNREDMTPRALAILQAADLVLAEDTRDTGRLLADFGLKPRLLSYHLHNERAREEEIIAKLASGATLALVSDAGMPCISDPGATLVAAVLAAGFEVIALPGANAGLTALAASGLTTARFGFEGFLPVKGKKREERLLAIRTYPDSLVLYEAPHRLRETLEDFLTHGLAERKIVLARELTKTYETYWRGTVAAALPHVLNVRPRGEYVLVLEGLLDYYARFPDQATQNREAAFAQACRETMRLIELGLRAKDAARYIASRENLKTNQLYRAVEQQNG